MFIIITYNPKDMGQSLMKLAPGSEERKVKEVVDIAEKCYDKFLANQAHQPKLPDFYRAVCSTVEEINSILGNTQFRVPETQILEEAFHKYHKNMNELTREEFQKILREVVTETGFTGIGAKDILLYIFGVPLTTLFIKQRTIPQAIPNEVFIPAITSLTVLVLAKFNKI